MAISALFPSNTEVKRWVSTETQTELPFTVLLDSTLSTGPSQIETEAKAEAARLRFELAMTKRELDSLRARTVPLPSQDEKEEEDDDDADAQLIVPKTEATYLETIPEMAPMPTRGPLVYKEWLKMLEPFRPKSLCQSNALALDQQRDDHVEMASMLAVDIMREAKLGLVTRFIETIGTFQRPVLIQDILDRIGKSSSDTLSMESEMESFISGRNSELKLGTADQPFTIGQHIIFTMITSLHQYHKALDPIHSDDKLVTSGQVQLTMLSFNISVLRWLCSIFGVHCHYLT